MCRFNMCRFNIRGLDAFADVHGTDRHNSTVTDDNSTVNKGTHISLIVDGADSC